MKTIKLEDKLENVSGLCNGYVSVSVCPNVCYRPVFYRNGWMGQHI